jgi:hypothetical protein
MIKGEAAKIMLAKFAGYEVKKSSEVDPDFNTAHPDPLIVWHYSKCSERYSYHMILSQYDPQNNLKDLFQIVDVIEKEYFLTTKLESLNTDSKNPHDVKYHFVIEYMHKISKVKVESDFLDTYSTRGEAIYNSCLNVVEKIFSLNN